MKFQKKMGIFSKMNVSFAVAVVERILPINFATSLNMRLIIFFLWLTVRPALFRIVILDL